MSLYDAVSYKRMYEQGYERIESKYKAVTVSVQTFRHFRSKNRQYCFNKVNNNNNDMMYLLGDGQHCLIKTSVDYVKSVDEPHRSRVETTQQH